ncbi:unnamed protein product [Cuscuta campestris]|uniref:Uncharacterized protein n=1 Tax=Cuscuta campestris TaxID=132261 RepID=A0A484N6X7_9ASTE|nr:unnamed protein product [Cuscuta campestris]
MIAAQELSEFLQMEIRLKFEEEVLEFYRNGEVKTAHSKKDPQRTFPVIMSTVGGTKVKLSQKKLGEKLRLPNSGIEIGKFPAKNLDWNIIGISGQIPSGPAKKADLNNDYKLILELVIACLECGSGGHADDITQERAFIINALITKTKNEEVIKKCLGIPVNHNCEDILNDYWVWQKNPEDLHMEYLANTPVSDCEADDEDTAVFKPVFSKVTEDQVALTSVEAAVEDFQTFPETSPAFETETSPAFQVTSHASEMVLTEVVQEKATSPPQEQNQETAAEEEIQQLIQSQVLETLTTPGEISNYTETEIPEKSAKIPEQSALPETIEQAVEVQRNSGEAEKETQMAEVEVCQTPVTIFEDQNTDEERDSLSRDISNFALDEAEGESERTLKVIDEEDVQEDAESLPMQLFQRTQSSHQVTNFHFHSSSTHTLPDEIPEIWTKKVQGLIESALPSQHASFRQEIEQMEAKNTQLLEKSEKKHSADLKEIGTSVYKTLEIISLLSNTVSNTMEIYASDSQLQFKEFNKIKEQIASVTVGLQKQMSLLQMDIRSVIAVGSANQAVTKDYLKVIIDNQKEAYKLFRLIGAHFGNRKMEVILQQHSPSPIPQLPIAVKEGEASYIPSHLNMTNLILEAQQRNPENSAQHLSSSGLDRTEFIGAVVDHFSDAAQSEERRENLRRIKELCGNMQGISEIAGSSKRKRN